MLIKSICILYSHYISWKCDPGSKKYICKFANLNKHICPIGQRKMQMMLLLLTMILMLSTCVSCSHEISWKCDPGSKKYRSSSLENILSLLIEITSKYQEIWNQLFGKYTQLVDRDNFVWQFSRIGTRIKAISVDLICSRGTKHR